MHRNRRGLMKNMVLCALLVIFAAAGCGGMETVSAGQNDKDYPSSVYMTAEGIGQSEPEAKNRAVAELSRIFESKVQADTLDKVKSVIKTSGKNTSETSEQMLQSRVNVISEVKLKGVEIGKVWKDKSEYHALAVLERKKARDEWVSEQGEIDRKVDGIVSTMQSTKSTLLKYKALKEIMDLWIKRTVISSRLNVLGFGGEAAPASYDINSIYKSQREAKTNMTIFIEIDGNKAKAVKEAVAGALGKAGFVIAKNKSNAAVIIDGSVDVSPLDMPNPDGWKYARAKVALSVIDAAEGVSIGDVTEDARGSHLSPGEAEQKALKKVLPDLSKKLIEFIEGSGEQSQ